MAPYLYPQQSSYEFFIMLVFKLKFKPYFWQFSRQLTESTFEWNKISGSVSRRHRLSGKEGGSVAIRTDDGQGIGQVEA
jgi:hypothetical protein